RTHRRGPSLGRCSPTISSQQFIFVIWVAWESRWVCCYGPLLLCTCFSLFCWLLSARLPESVRFKLVLGTNLPRRRVAFGYAVARGPIDRLRPHQCPLWVKSRHSRALGRCPLSPEKRT